MEPFAVHLQGQVAVSADVELLAQDENQAEQLALKAAGRREVHWVDAHGDPITVQPDHFEVGAAQPARALRHAFPTGVAAGMELPA